MTGILGKKLGMTQIYMDDGRAIPVTVIKAGPCRVVQVKSADGADGYSAVQVGLLEDAAPKHLIKAAKGHLEKAGVGPVRRLAEFEVDSSGEAEVEAGAEIKCSIFAEDDYVDVAGTSKGKGFQGVMKRYGFGGGKATHGSMHHRAPGSIGNSAWPSRVYPGKKLPGQTGDKRITTKNLQVVKVDEENDLLYLRGAVPGAKNGYLEIRPAKRG